MADKSKYEIWEDKQFAEFTDGMLKEDYIGTFEFIELVPDFLLTRLIIFLNEKIGYKLNSFTFTKTEIVRFSDYIDGETIMLSINYYSILLERKPSNYLLAPR